MHREIKSTKEDRVYEIDKKLLEREAAGRPVAVAVVGAGQMGSEIICQIGEMKGMEVLAVVDLSFDSSRAGLPALQEAR